MIKVSIVSHTMDPEGTVAKAGKLCYSPIGIDEMDLKEGEVNKFVNMLTSMHHESPLEHASFTFAVEGISRITEIQLVRHRIAAYSIQSGRYVKRESPKFVTPPRVENNTMTKQRYNRVVKESIEAYNEIFMYLMMEKLGYSGYYLAEFESDQGKDQLNDFMINKVQTLLDTDKKLYSMYEKECMEDARYAHLQSIETKVCFTMNARSLLNLFEKRTCRRAQWEISELAREVLSQASKVAPTLFKYAGPSCVKDKCKEGSMSCGNPLTVEELFR